MRRRYTTAAARAAVPLVVAQAHGALAFDLVGEAQAAPAGAPLASEGPSGDRAGPGEPSTPQTVTVSPERIDRPPIEAATLVARTPVGDLVVGRCHRPDTTGRLHLRAVVAFLRPDGRQGGRVEILRHHVAAAARALVAAVGLDEHDTSDDERDVVYDRVHRGERLERGTWVRQQGGRRRG